MPHYQRVTCSKVFTSIIFLNGFINTLLSNPIDRSASGLDEFKSVVDFSEMRLLDSSEVTNQFFQFGITFAPRLFYRTTDNPDWASVSGPNLRTGDPEVNPFSIIFNDAHRSAAVVLIAQPPTPATVTAKLGGVDVESFETTISIDNPDQYFGFENIIFDEIEVSYTGATRLRVDNVQLGERVVLDPLKIINITHQEVDGEKLIEIVWNSRPGRIYAVYTSEDLSQWNEVDDDISSAGEKTSFNIEGLLGKKGKVFYKVEDITK